MVNCTGIQRTDLFLHTKEIASIKEEEEMYRVLSESKSHSMKFEKEKDKFSTDLGSFHTLL